MLSADRHNIGIYYAFNLGIKQEGGVYDYVHLSRMGPLDGSAAYIYGDALQTLISSRISGVLHLNLQSNILTLSPHFVIERPNLFNSVTISCANSAVKET